MIIETNEKNSKEFIEDFLSIATNYDRISKKHDAKVKNVRKYYLVYLVICIIAAVGFGVLAGIDSDGRIFWVVAAVLFAVSTLLCAVILWSFGKTVKNYIAANSGKSVVTIDADGIGLESANSQSVKLPWNKIMQVRFSKQSIVFLPTEKTLTMIAMEIKHKDEVMKALETEVQQKPEIVEI